jgi:hypothetical protein
MAAQLNVATETQQENQKGHKNLSMYSFVIFQLQFNSMLVADDLLID